MHPSDQMSIDQVTSPGSFRRSSGAANSHGATGKGSSQDGKVSERNQKGLSGGCSARGQHIGPKDWTLMVERQGISVDERSQYREFEKNIKSHRSIPLC